MKDIAHETTDKLLDKTENAMQEIYNKVYADLKKELVKASNKIETLPSDATIQQRINAWNKYDRLNNLETQIAEQLATANKEAMKLSNQMHNQTYKDNYDYTAYLIETGSDNIGTMPILDKSAINEYIEKGYSPFTRIALDDLQDKKVIYRAIAREMASGIALGEGNNKLATRLRKVVNKDYSSAVRIARTETTRIEGNARQQVYDTAKQKGIETKKEWVSTLDGDTRRDHRKLDGQIVDIDEYFKIGSSKAKYPGDFGEASEDINCRCTTRPVLEGYTAKRVTYEEWEKERNSNVKKPVKENITEKTIKVETIKEAEEMAKKLGVENVALGKINIDTANELLTVLNTVEKTPKTILGSSKILNDVAGVKIDRRANSWYGVNLSNITDLNMKKYGGKYEFINDDVIVYNLSTFKKLEDITKQKNLIQEAYIKKTGNKWFFNTDGKATLYHEIGHYNAKTSKEFEMLAKKWHKESNIDMLKDTNEAWAEAYAGYYTNNKELPEYIYEYVKNNV